MAREKKCPQCAEMVKADAKICRFCGHQFPQVTTPARMGLGKKLLIGFGGLFGLSVLFQIGQPRQSGIGNGQSESASKIDVDPGRKDKDVAAYLAKQAVPTALKDPSSAEFGDVWGMSANLACGFVNAKNSFGAMTGQSRFIFDSGRVEFEKMDGSLARRWNAVCVDKPHTPAPTGVGNLRWGARPTDNLKQYAPTTDEGLALYVPKAPPGSFEGVPVAESDYSFDHKKLWSADYYIDGESNRDAILSALVKKFGTPQTYDESAGSYAWKWPSAKVSVHLNYEANHGRTTVTYSHDDK